MKIQGNHQFQNYNNNGQAVVMARAFNPDGSPARLMELDEFELEDLDEVELEELDEVELEDLANFGAIQQNADMNFTGTHMVKKLNTGEKSTTNFNDHKDGQFVTVA